MGSSSLSQNFWTIDSKGAVTQNKDTCGVTVANEFTVPRIKYPKIVLSAEGVPNSTEFSDELNTKGYTSAPSNRSIWVDVAKSSSAKQRCPYFCFRWGNGIVGNSLTIVGRITGENGMVTLRSYLDVRREEVTPWTVVASDDMLILLEMRSVEREDLTV